MRQCGAPLTAQRLGHGDAPRLPARTAAACCHLVRKRPPPRGDPPPPLPAPLRGCGPGHAEGPRTPERGSGGLGGSGGSRCVLQPRSPARQDMWMHRPTTCPFPCCSGPVARAPASVLVYPSRGSACHTATSSRAASHRPGGLVSSNPPVQGCSRPEELASTAPVRGKTDHQPRHRGP